MGPNNIVMGWTPDGESIVYRSRKQSFNPFKGHLYTVQKTGGIAEQLPFSVAGFCSYSPDGSKMAFNRVFREFRTWKYYQGGMADDIRVFDFNNKTTEIITDNPANHLAGLGAITVFSLAFYGVFAKFREQVCTIACPYGRLQGVLLDNKSIIVAYDHKRGEKELGRSKFRRNEFRPDTGKGDCIDCFQCVHVCPTGIDIRNGTQLECVNCTACIDACDHIMEAVNLPKGLIRYASEDNIEKKTKFTFGPRLKGYTAVLMILITVFIGMLFLRNDVEARILRLPGQLYEHKAENIISNVYTFKLINKTTYEIEEVRFELLSHEGIIKVVAHTEFKVPKQGLAEGTLFIEISQNELSGDKDLVEIGVYSGSKLIETTTATFLGPRSYK